MNRRFARCFRVVAAVHLLVLLGLTAGSCWPFARRREELSLPVEFVVEVRAPAPVEPAPVAPAPVDPPPVEPPPAVEPTPLPPLRKKKIETSKRRITREKDAPAKQKLSAKEIRELLEKGA